MSKVSKCSNNTKNYSESNQEQWLFKPNGKTSNNVQLLNIFSAQQHIRYSALYAIARPSICLSVHPSHRWISQRSRNLHHRVAPMTPVSWRLTSQWNSKGKIESGGAE